MAANTHEEMIRAEIGDDVVITIVPSATRTTLFPEQGAVFGRGLGSLEIILLRQEVALRTQIGTVMDHEGHQLRLDFRPGVLDSEMVDIGHVRMDIEPAVDMAMGILSLAIHNGTELEALVQRLQSAHVQAT
ncbi:MAG: hypothetical protein AB1448_05140 [Pseudomonadota bacterium]